MAPFRPLPDHELDRLTDEALIVYICAARDAGDHAAAQRGLAVLVYGHWRNVERRVALKLPAHHVEDLTGDIIMQTIESAFAGTSVGEFVNWLKTITARAIADHYRRGPGKDPAPAALDPRDEDHPGADPAAPDEQGYVETRDAIDRVLTTRTDDHQAVIRRIIFEGLPAAKAGAPDGISEANAHQIASRFRRDLRRELDGNTPPEPT